MPESQEEDDDDVDEREAEVERFIAVVLVSSQNIYSEIFCSLQEWKDSNELSFHFSFYLFG